jgi:hypothetical protein
VNRFRTTFQAVALGLAGALSCVAQTPDPVAVQLRELAAQLAQMRQELADSKKESSDLRKQVEELRQQVETLRGTPTNAAVPVLTPEQLTEEHELLAAKVEDQYQTKVESSSKYRVKLSGMALFTTGFTAGGVNNLDLPSFAEESGAGESGGAFSATVRQTILGLDVDGPQLWGARTSGQIRADFFGSASTLPNGIANSYLRIRTARLRLDWKNSSLEIGQESPFFSPLSPTSLVSTAYPSMWNSGNLWTWIPQANVTHKFRSADKTRVVLQYGVLDPFTGELPHGEYDRAATAGERTRTPAVAMRVGAERGTDRKTAFGAGLFYSRQNWGFDRKVKSWAATVDYEIPLGRFVTLSGELYRGRAMGGLGGSVGRTVLASGPLSMMSTRILPIQSGGGWAQFKVKPNQRWEFNAAFGGDFPFRGSIPKFPAIYADEEYSPQRNTSGTANFIYQPRNNLLFSIEYRRLWTSPFDGPQVRANHVGIGAGILF